MPLCHETSAWARLQAHWRQEVRAIDLAAQFERDGARLTTRR